MRGILVVGAIIAVSQPALAASAGETFWALSEGERKKALLLAIHQKGYTCGQVSAYTDKGTDQDDAQYVGAVCTSGADFIVQFTTPDLRYRVMPCSAARMLGIGCP